MKILKNTLLLGACSLYSTAFLCGQNQQISNNSSVQGEGRKNKPLNVLFIVADDLGWSALACYGSDLNETPDIDQLAAKSYKFTNSYAAAPVCSPNSLGRP